MGFSDKTERFEELSSAAAVWISEVSRVAESNAAALLSPEEASRLETITPAPARRSFIAARALLKRALSTYVDVPPAKWRIDATPFGAIHIADEQNSYGLVVNLSKSRDWVAAIVSTAPCGVDIEDTRRPVDPLDDAGGVLTDREREPMAGMDDDARRLHFFKLWCLKEAYVKARGTGFHVNPESVDIILGDETDIRVDARRPDGKPFRDAAAFRLNLFFPDDNHILAAAGKMEETSIQAMLVNYMNGETA